MTDEAMLREHRATYDGFVRLMTWSTVLVVITLALMAIFLL